MTTTNTDAPDLAAFFDSLPKARSYVVSGRRPEPATQIRYSTAAAAEAEIARLAEDPFTDVMSLGVMDCDEEPTPGH